MTEKRVSVRSFNELTEELDRHPDADRLRAEAVAELTAELVAYSASVSCVSRWRWTRLFSLGN